MPDPSIERAPTTAEHRARAAKQLADQAGYCAQIGSTFYAGLLAQAAQDELAGGPVADLLSGYEAEPAGAAVPLRLMGAVHALVLSGRAPTLAAHYPSVGGQPDAARAWPLFREVLATEREVLSEWLTRAPQTNEVGRGAALAGGLHVLATATPTMRLVEIGASGGLNLRADRFRLGLPGGWVGPADSPLVIEDAWRGAHPEPAAFEVVERIGCDLSPIDPLSMQGRIRLQAYVWPDQPERLARLRGALELARTVPAQVVRSGASEFLQALELRSGTTTVVWHSVMWQYLDPAEQRAIMQRLDVLGAAAQDDAALAYLRLEPVVDAGRHLVFQVGLRRWPGGEDLVLGTAPAHGVPVEWVPVEWAPAKG